MSLESVKATVLDTTDNQANPRVFRYVNSCPITQANQLQVQLVELIETETYLIVDALCSWRMHERVQAEKLIHVIKRMLQSLLGEMGRKTYMSQKRC